MTLKEITMLEQIKVQGSRSMANYDSWEVKFE
jgi:hypothetical protein